MKDSDLQRHQPADRRRPLDRPIVFTLVVVAVALVASGTWLDRTADGYYEEAFKRALVTFALARTLNGVISVVQGTEVALEPGGVGVVLTPGELIDPVNDLIERFSWIMLVATTSLGIQKVLMDISAWEGMRILMGVTAVSAIIIVWALPQRRRARRFALRMVLLVGFLRFAMPLMVVFNTAIHDHFMSDDYIQSTQAVETASQDLSELNRNDADEQQVEGMGASIRRWLEDKSRSMDVRARLNDYEQRISGATEHLLRLAAVFILQTVLLPVGFLWALALAIRNLGRFR